MKSPYSFLITPLNNARYDNISKYGDKTLIKSTSQEDHTATNRFGVIQETPVINFFPSIKKGDIIVLHHNVFRKFYDMIGAEQSGPCHFRDNTYIVELEQIYLFKHKDKWKSVGDYCFVKPIEKEKDILMSLEKHKDLQGVIVYGNKGLEKLDVYEGDNVLFTPESEYEFEIDGEVLYRMKTKDICVLI